MLVVMAVSRGRISEHQLENNFYNSAFVSANSARYFDKTGGAEPFPTLVVISKFTDCCMGSFALACSRFYASRLDGCRKGNLPALLIPVSLVTREVVFSFWRKGNVFAL